MCDCGEKGVNEMFWKNSVNLSEKTAQGSHLYYVFECLHFKF